MSNNIQAFDFKDNLVRAIKDDNENPLFYAKDICAALEIINVSQACGRLDDDEKGIYEIDTLGGKQSVLMVNESGLYSLIFTSKKKEAKIFKKWVTSEVLPSIRKTGSYLSGSEFESRLSKLEQSLIAPPQIKTKPVNISGIDPADILKIDAIMTQHGRCGIAESGIYSLAKRNFVNKVVAKKIIRMFIEDGEKFQAISEYDEYNRNLKFKYFLKDVEIK